MDLHAPFRPVISVVVPMYNEAAVIGETHRRLAAVMATLDTAWEVVYVNDGSRDATLAAVEALRATDPHIALLNLSRNFGKEIATTAGLDHARGDAIIVIDADLQDPPEVIPQLDRGMARRLRHGLRAAPHARRRRLAEKADRRGVLPRDAQPG